MTLPSTRILASISFPSIPRIPPTSTLFPYTTLFRSRVQQTYKHSVPRFFVPEHGTMFTLALVRLNTRSEERFSRNAETDLVCRLLLEKKNIEVSRGEAQQLGQVDLGAVYGHLPHLQL